jgi:hypothetical protein
MFAVGRRGLQPSTACLPVRDALLRGRRANPAKECARVNGNGGFSKPIANGPRLPERRDWRASIVRRFAAGGRMPPLPKRCEVPPMRSSESTEQK